MMVVRAWQWLEDAGYEVRCVGNAIFDVEGLESGVTLARLIELGERHGKKSLPPEHSGRGR